MPLRNRRRQGERGQVVVIFGGAMLLFFLLAAAVIDLSWYWTSNLKMQRAADAAALAGVVYLPDTTKAYPAAVAEATKNGYTAPTYTVTPIKDPDNERRLKVTISGNINTFFARVIGINAFAAIRESKADFVLPVPMGSPQQWYGVGTFEKVDITQGPDVAGATADTGWRRNGTTPAGNWTNPGNADATDNNAYAVSTIANGSSQQWSGFGLQGGAGPVPTGAVIEGIQVRYRALITGSGGSTTTCQLQTHLSWNAGVDWTTAPATQTLTTGEASYTMGNAGNLTAWPRTAGSGNWAYASFTDTNFRVRFTWNKATCGANRTASVDTLEVRVTYHPMLPGPFIYTPATVAVPTPPGETVAPTSQGFWGAIFTAGGARRNGDRYAPRWTYGGSAVPNVEHLDEGYDYTIELGSNGRVHLFDPVFCATGSNPAGSGNYGAGDHWTELPTGGTTNGPVTTEFSLYNTNNTPLNPGDDTLAVAPLVYTSRGSDQSGQFDNPAATAGGPGAGDIPTGAPITDCRNDPAHNAWVTMQTGLLAGTYRLNVKSSQAANAGTAAENLWSIYVGDNGGAGSARVYGASKMVAYSNLTGSAATQLFYLAQIDAVHAGKTMEIQLFDPGDVAGDATLRVKSPDGNAYNYATFSYQADAQCINARSDSCSGTNRNSIRTNVSGTGSSFDNTVITISIDLPSTYGSIGLTPAGESEAGWWKIEYTVGAANDTTTWQVDIIGNPVHLVLP